jgi:tetratricopeptide (TPR) repeat protein
MLEQALAMDSGYAPAWLSLSRRYYMEARYGSGDASFLARGEAAARRALVLDPNSDRASAGLVIRQVERGEVAAALRQGEAMVRRRPDSVDAHFSLSYALRFAGLLDESASHCETAFVLDQRTDLTGLRSCAVVFLLRGDEARANQFLRVDEGSEFSRSLRMDIAMRKGRAQEAARLGSMAPLHDASYRMLQACAANAPRTEVSALAAAVTASDDPETNYFRAAHLASCGETGRSLELLRRAVEGSYCAYPAMDRDPLLASVRSDAEFARVRAAGMICQEKLAGARGSLQTE